MKTAAVIDHNRLGKELLRLHLPDFMKLFAPRIAKDIDWSSFEILDKELNELTRIKKRSNDVIAKVKYKNVLVFLIIHIELQSQSEAGFARRMFVYYSRLHEKYGLPIYPIVLCTYDMPRRPEPDYYQIHFPGLKVLSFRFQVVQLNRLDWHKFKTSRNPIACALMAKMKMANTERYDVKLESLQNLGKLNLNEASKSLISCIVDTYLKLDAREERKFQFALNRIEPQLKERVMELTTSWMQKGEKKGEKKGAKKGEKKGKLIGVRETVLRLLRKRFGPLDTNSTKKISVLPLSTAEELSEALLEFSGSNDLVKWLESKSIRSGK